MVESCWEFNVRFLLELIQSIPFNTIHIFQPAYILLRWAKIWKWFV